MNAFTSFQSVLVFKTLLLKFNDILFVSLLKKSKIIIILDENYFDISSSLWDQDIYFRFSNFFQSKFYFQTTYDVLPQYCSDKKDD